MEQPAGAVPEGAMAEVTPLGTGLATATPARARARVAKDFILSIKSGE